MLSTSSSTYVHDTSDKLFTPCGIYWPQATIKWNFTLFSARCVYVLYHKSFNSLSKCVPAYCSTVFFVRHMNAQNTYSEICPVGFFAGLHWDFSWVQVDHGSLSLLLIWIMGKPKFGNCGSRLAKQSDQDVIFDAFLKLPFREGDVYYRKWGLLLFVTPLLLSSS